MLAIFVSPITPHILDYCKSKNTNLLSVYLLSLLFTPPILINGMERYLFRRSPVLKNPTLKIDGYCTICMQNELISPLKTPCNHIYCYDCISRWLEKDESCPICRRDLALEDLAL